MRNSKFAILCAFCIVLIVVLIGVFKTLDSFTASFKASETALGDFLVFLIIFVKYMLIGGGILVLAYASAKVYWSVHKELQPTPEGNYPALVSPRMRVTEIEPGNGPTPTTYHYNQQIEEYPQAQIVETTGASMPSAPPFSQIAHLNTPERIVLNYIASGPVYGEIDDLLSMALIGKPKRGKTTALLYYLCILLKARAEVWIWDPHGEMNELAYGLHYFTDMEDIADSAVLLEDELNQRSEIYKTEGKRVKHPLVLLVDEVPVIARWEKIQQKAKRKLPASPYAVMERFTLEARKWRGFVFISGQSLPADVLPTITRDNLSSRLVLECSADHARMIGLPKNTIDTLLPALRGAERGTHIADFSSWSQPELADIPYTTIDDLRAIIDGRDVNTVNGSVNAFTEDDGPIHYDYPAFTGKQKAASERPFKVITGNLVNTVNEPVESGEDLHQCSPEDKKRIIRLARVQQNKYGRVVRTKIRDEMNWNNKKYPIIQQVLDAEGL